MSETQIEPCGFFKRLFAIGYDLLLLFSVLFLATLAVLPLTKGAAIESGNPFYFLYLFFCTYLYFCWQWQRGGQTLGMQAWRIRLICSDEAVLDWPLVSRRFLLACLSVSACGIGFLWSLFDKERLAFHDRFSNTRLIIDRSA